MYVRYVEGGWRPGCGNYKDWVNSWGIDGTCGRGLIGWKGQTESETDCAMMRMQRHTGRKTTELDYFHDESRNGSGMVDLISQIDLLYVGIK